VTKKTLTDNIISMSVCLCLTVCLSLYVNVSLSGSARVERRAGAYMFERVHY